MTRQVTQPPSIKNDPALLPAASRRAAAGSGLPAFSEVLQQKLVHGVRFSQHAEQRLRARNISLSSEHLDRLNTAVDQAARKGARDSLVLLDNLALVVSVKNRTVITAVDQSSLKNNLFTNIDSAIIV